MTRIWHSTQVLYRSFLIATVCLFALFVYHHSFAQGIEKIKSDQLNIPNAEATWNDAEKIFAQATKLEENGQLEQSATAYENAINIFRGLQLMDDAFKKDLVSLRITTCKLRSSSLRRIAQNAKNATATTQVAASPTEKTVKIQAVETKVTEKPTARTGSIIEQISQMESEISALRTENLALIENMKTLKSSEAELAKIKDLEKLIEQRRLEIEALKSNMNFVEARWTKEVEAKIAAQNEVKSVKIDAEEQMSKLLQQKTQEMEERVRAVNELAKNEREKNEKRINEHYKNELAKMSASLDSYQAKIVFIQAQNAKVIEEKEKTIKDLKLTHTEQLDKIKKESEQNVFALNKKIENIETTHAQNKLTFEQDFNKKLAEKDNHLLTEKTNLERSFLEARLALENQIKTLQAERVTFENNLKQKNQEELALLKSEKQVLAETSVKQKNELETRLTEQEKQIESLKKQVQTFDEQKISLIEQNNDQYTEKLANAQKDKENALGLMKKSFESQISNQQASIAQLEKQLSLTAEEAQSQLKKQDTLVAEKGRLEIQIESMKNEIGRTKELANNSEKDAKNKIFLMQKEMENAISATSKAKSQQLDLEDLVRKRDEEIRKMRQNQVSPREFQRKQEALEALMAENLELKKQLQTK